MTLNTALVAPMPRARERMAVRVKPGRLRSSRPAKSKSDSKDCIDTSHGNLHVLADLGGYDDDEWPMVSWPGWRRRIFFLRRQGWATDWQWQGHARDIRVRKGRERRLQDDTEPDQPLPPQKSRFSS